MGRGDARVHVVLQTSGTGIDAARALPSGYARYRLRARSHKRASRWRRAASASNFVRPKSRMFLNSGLITALDRIAERAADVRRAYTPGAIPRHDDVATPALASDFTLDPLAVSRPTVRTSSQADNESARCVYARRRLRVARRRFVGADGQPIMGVQRPGADDPTELRVDPVDESLGRVRRRDNRARRHALVSSRSDRPAHRRARIAARRCRPHRAGSLSGWDAARYR